MIASHVKRRFKRAWRKRARWVNRNFIALSVALLHMYLLSSSFGGRIEPMLLDVWSSARGVTDIPEEVAIISINEESYAALGLSTLEPWPRKKHTELLKRLRDAGVKLVVFDMFFRQSGADAAEDTRFAESLEIVPTFIGSYERAQATKTDSSNSGHGVEYRPHDLFAAHARRVVMLHGTLDHGVVRRFTVDGNATSAKTPPFVQALLSELAPGETAPAPHDFIRYYGPPGTMQSLGYHEALTTAPDELRVMLKDRIVFIGIQTGADAGIVRKDSFMTSFVGRPMFGVEIHATAAANVLRKDWLRRLTPLQEHLMLDLFAFVMTLGVLLCRPLTGAALLAGTALIWGAASYSAFLLGWFVPGLLLVVVILPAVGLLTTFYYYLIMHRSYTTLESALGVRLHVQD